MERCGAADVLATDVPSPFYDESIRRVCGDGHLVLRDTVSAPLSLLPSPLARLDARRDGREWFVFNRRGMRRVVELAGWTVETQTGMLADRPGPLPQAQQAHRTWKWRVGVRGRSCAILAS